MSETLQERMAVHVVAAMWDLVPPNTSIRFMREKSLTAAARIFQEMETAGALVSSAPTPSEQAMAELEEIAYAVHAEACREGRTSPALERISAWLQEYWKEELEDMGE